VQYEAHTVSALEFDTRIIIEAGPSTVDAQRHALIVVPAGDASQQRAL